MAAAGLLVYALESARIKQAVNEQIDQEIAEFRALRGGNDPDTASPFTDAAQLLNTFLTRNVPDDDEMLVAYTGGAARGRTPNRYGEDVPGRSGLPPDSGRTPGRAVGPRPSSRPSTARSGSRSCRCGSTTATRATLVIVNFLDDEHSELNRTLQTYGIVALLSLGIITLLAGFQSGRLLSPLRTLQETASDITASDLSRRIPERGNDDITALTRTINHMLDRLESTFTTQREFLDDAGHELKTPLTVLRGHLELLDDGSPADVAATRALLLDEVDRMARLVERPDPAGEDRPPRLPHADSRSSLERLTATVLAKARGLGERDWQSDGSGDGDRLRRRAAAHPGPARARRQRREAHQGRRRGGASARRTTTARCACGCVTPAPVCPLADREVIFERFGRSRVRPGDEGFGLGLSIVRAIAEAHGGTVHVEDAMPRGSRFVITLPTGTRLGAKQKEDTWPAS